MVCVRIAIRYAHGIGTLKTKKINLIRKRIYYFPKSVFITKFYLRYKWEEICCCFYWEFVTVLFIFKRTQLWPSHIFCFGIAAMCFFWDSINTFFFFLICDSVRMQPSPRVVYRRYEARLKSENSSEPENRSFSKDHTLCWKTI